MDAQTSYFLNNNNFINNVHYAETEEDYSYLRKQGHVNLNNLILVPTVSFPPLPTEKETSQIANCKSINCVQTTVKDISVPSPSAPISSKPILQTADDTKAETPGSFGGTRTSDSCTDYSYKRDNNLTVGFTPSMSPSIKELSTLKYKSRNNLVDLTGFNILKLKRAANTTIKDRRQTENTNMEQDLTKAKVIKKTKNLKPDSRTEKNKNKKPSKSDTKIDSHRKENTKDSSKSESKKNKAEIEDKMKMYFEQLWKQNIEKLKDNTSNHEKRERDSKSSKTTKLSNDSKIESSRTKTKLQKTSKNIVTKSPKDKIDTTKKYDVSNRKSIIAESSKRSKSETKNRLVGDKTEESIRNQKGFLSPKSAKRYKDFQRFIRKNGDNDDELSRKKKKKTENLFHIKNFVKSKENIKNSVKTSEMIINTEQGKNIDDYKKPVKSILHTKVSTTNDNTDKKKLRSIVRVNKNQIVQRSQNKCINENFDLRSKLSRKRTRGECLVNRENLVITLKNDINIDPKISKTITHTVKPTTKKYKKIKLVINIECPGSESDDSDQNMNECCPSPQDLSFLDDFNVDEIVDSLNVNQLENNKINTTENIISQLTNKMSDNVNNIRPDKEDKPKQRLINDLNVTQIVKKEEPNNERQVIVINSDTEDVDSDVKITSDNTRINVREEIDLTGNQYKDKQDEPLDLCDVSNDSIQEIIDITKEETRRTSKNPLVASNNKNKLECNVEDNVKRIFELLTKTVNSTEINQKAEIEKNIETLTTSNTTVKASIADIKVEDNLKQSTAKNTKKDLLTLEDPVEVSLENMFNKIAQNKQSLKTDTVQFKGLCKHEKQEHCDPQKPRDTVEASLESLFNNFGQNNAAKKIEKEQFNSSEKKVKEENVTSPRANDTVEASFESMFNEIQQDSNINIGLSRSLDQHIKKDAEKILNPQVKTETPLTTLKADKNTNNSKNKAEISKNAHNKYIKRDNINWKKSINEKNLETPESKIQQKVSVEVNKTLKQQAELLKNTKNSNNITKITNIAIDPKPSHIPNTNVKEKRPQTSEATPKKSLEKFVKHTADKITDSKTDKGNIQHLHKPKDIIKKTPSTTLNVSGEKENIINNTVTPAQPLDMNMNIKEKIEEATLSKEISTKKSVAAKSIVDQKAANQIVSTTTTNSDLNNKAKAEKIENPKVTTKEYVETINKSENKPDTNIKKSYETQKNTELNLQKSQDTTKILDTAIKNTETTKNNKEKEERKSQDRSSLETLSNNTNIETTKNPNNKKTIDEKADIIQVQKSETTPNNNVKKKADIVPSIVSAKNIKPTEKHLQKPGVAAGKSLKTCNNVPHKANNTGLYVLANTNKNINNESSKCLPSSNKTQVFMTTNNNSIKTAAKPNKEENQIKPQVTINNNKTGTVTGNLSTKTDSNIKIATKDRIETKHADIIQPKVLHTVEADKKQGTSKGDLSKKEVIGIKINAKDSQDKQAKTNTATNSKIGQKSAQKAPNATENTDMIQKNNKIPIEVKLEEPPTLESFEQTLEARMLQCLYKKYKVMSVIQRGCFSNIYRCKDPEGKMYAVKVFKINNQDVNGDVIKNMLATLKNYKSILNIIKGFTIQGMGRCLLTEYYPTNLEDALKRNERSFPIDLVQCLARQLVDAVDALSYNNIVHTDINPTHILLNGQHNKLKLCGFDTAKYEHQLKISPEIGTLNYRAPEIILGFQEDQKIDVWSTALVIFKMATNKELIFETCNHNVLYQQFIIIGSPDWYMVNRSTQRNFHFAGNKIKRKIKKNVYVFETINSNHGSLRDKIFSSYNHQWEPYRLKWQVSKDLEKLESLHRLLEQMLVLDPRNRLPIQFVGASEFIHT